MKYHPKKIYSLEELKYEPVTYRTLGGLEGILRQGLQKQAQAERDILLHDLSYAAGQDRGIDIGFKQGKSVGLNQGYIAGGKDFMVKGDKYVILHKDSEQPLFSGSYESAFKTQVGGHPLTKTLADYKIGKTFEESPFFKEAQENVNNYKQFIDYDTIAFSVKEELLDDDDETQAKNALDKANKKIQKIEGKSKKKYSIERNKYLGGSYSTNFMREFGGTNKTPFLLMDDWHIYNTTTLHDYDKPNPKLPELAKDWDLRSKKSPLESQNIQDYIFSPGLEFQKNIEADIKKQAEESTRKVVEFQIREGIKTPLVAEWKAKHQPQEKPKLQPHPINFDTPVFEEEIDKTEEEIDKTNEEIDKMMDQQLEKITTPQQSGKLGQKYGSPKLGPKPNQQTEPVVRQPSPSKPKSTLALYIPPKQDKAIDVPKGPPKLIPTEEKVLPPKSGSKPTGPPKLIPNTNREPEKKEKTPKKSTASPKGSKTENPKPKDKKKKPS